MAPSLLPAIILIWPFLVALLKDSCVCLPAGERGSLNNKSEGKINLAPFEDVGLRLEKRTV